MRYLMLLLICATSFGQDVATDLVNTPAVRAAFRDLEREASNGWSQTECAAFVVRDGTTIRLVHWPATHEFERQHYRGTLPQGVIAIVHTHPAMKPMPSPDDAYTAHQLAIPVLVLTPWHICAAEPSGETIVILRNRYWLLADR